MSEGLPPRFRPGCAAPAAVTRFTKPRERSDRRGSPRTRGLDARWDRLSKRYRRANPFCEESARRGIDAPVEVVDHIIPREERPDLAYEWSNLQSLTARLHDGWKQEMEAYARRTGQIHMLPEWCKNPSSRPQHFRLLGA